MTHPKLTFGLQDGQLLHVSEVDNGLRCGCTCPACSSPLIARKGTKVQHHFAHQGKVDCQHAVETALHQAAKKIIEDERAIWLPKLTLGIPRYREQNLVVEARKYAFDLVTVEESIDAIRPDIVASIGDRKLLVEIYVTHPVDGSKLARIREMKYSAVEIDLSDVPRDLDWEALREIVVGETKNKRWLYNVEARTAWHEILQFADRKPIIERGFATHVDLCPINSRTWKGRSYANVVDDCLYCRHNIHLEEGSGNWVAVFCDGREPTT